jgi:excisionase family DNA binding protein
MLTLAAAAARLTISRRTLARLIAAGEIAAVRVTSRRIAIEEEEIARFVAARRVAPCRQADDRTVRPPRDGRPAARDGADRLVASCPLKKEKGRVIAAKSLFLWCWCADSNRGPTDYETDVRMVSLSGSEGRRCREAPRAAREVARFAPGYFLAAISRTTSPLALLPALDPRK